MIVLSCPSSGKLWGSLISQLPGSSSLCLASHLLLYQTQSMGNVQIIFEPSRGIRQGDPLSPYIFILCMEYLSCLIQDKVSKGSWTGVKTSRNGPTFTHLFFANDLIFFAKSTRKNCTIISRVLENFCCALGQKINFSKSKVFIPPYLDRTYFVFLEEELGLKISNSFSKYLEVPIIVDGRD